MCRLLAELTHTDVRMMAETVRRLEHRSGLPGVDIRLTSDIHATIHLKMRALGLDPHDTTPQELYVALLNMAANHDRFLKLKFSLPTHTSMAGVAKDTAHIYERLRFNRRCWLVRPTVIKRILRAHPPKTLIKQLGYRTADSMIKRESADVLLFLALNSESNTWQQQLDIHLRKLTAVDFEERLIEVETLDNPRYQAIAFEITAKHHTLVYGVPLIGKVFVLPAVSAVRPGLLLLTLTMALKEATELQYVHSHLRHYQMEGSFGTKVVDALRSRNLSTVSVAGHPFGWHLVHRHYGSQSSDNHPTLFQPHLQADDLAYRRAEDILYHVEPALHFWHGLEYVGLPTVHGPLSFNLLDVLVNLANGLDLANRHNSHLTQAVWDELLLRYLKQPAVEHSLLSGLAAKEEVAQSQPRSLDFVL